MTLRSLVLLPTLLLSPSFTAPSATAASLEERVLQLETRLTELAQENAVLKKQLGHNTKGKPGAAVVFAQGKERKLAIGGFIQAHAEFGESPDARFPGNDRFLMRRARLGVKGAFAEHFDFVLQADFGNNSLGSTNGYRAQLTDCAITWNRSPLATITFGQFKTPYGFEQLLPDTKNSFVERSLPNDQLTLSRQLGAMVSGATLEKRLGYSAALFNGSGANNGGNDNDQFLYVGRLTGVLMETEQARLAVGANAFSTRDKGSFVGRRNGIGFDAQASYGPLDLQAEYLRTRFDCDTGTDTTADGWSLLGAWMLIPKTLQGLVRYEIYDPNGTSGGDHTDLWTIGFNYFIKGDDLKLTVNYLIGDPAGPLSSQIRLISRFQVIF